MADKTLELLIRTLADTHGVDAVEQALAKVEPAAQKAAAAADDVGKKGKDALDKIDQRTAGESFANLGDSIAAAGQKMKGLAEDVSAMNPELAKTIDSFGNLAEKSGTAASAIATGFAAGGPIGAGLAAATVGGGLLVDKLIEMKVAMEEMNTIAGRMQEAVDVRASRNASSAEAARTAFESERARRVSADFNADTLDQLKSRLTEAGGDAVIGAVKADAQDATKALLARGQGLLREGEKAVLIKEYEAAVTAQLKYNNAGNVGEADKYKEQADALDARIAADDAARQATGVASLDQLKALAKQFDDVAAQADERIAKLAEKSKPDVAALGQPAVTTPAPGTPGYQGFPGQNPALAGAPAPGFPGMAAPGGGVDGKEQEIEKKSEQITEKDKALIAIQAKLDGAKIKVNEAEKLAESVDKLAGKVVATAETLKSVGGAVRAGFDALIEADSTLRSDLQGLGVYVQAIEARVRRLEQNSGN